MVEARQLSKIEKEQWMVKARRLLKIVKVLDRLGVSVPKNGNLCWIAKACHGNVIARQRNSVVIELLVEGDAATGLLHSCHYLIKEKYIL